MTRVIKFIIIALAITTSANIAFSQPSSDELLKRAKAAGLSEKEIAEYSKQYQGSQNQSKSLNKSDNISQDSTAMGSDRVFTKYGNNSLSIEEVVADSVKIRMTFGHGTFKQDKIVYEPNLNIPTPTNYVLSVGDEVIISIWGDSQMAFRETITPDGVINIDNIGQIYLNGLTSNLAKERIQIELSKSIKSLGITSQMSFSLGKIRSIKVHVTGEATVPGTYTVPSLATVLHILTSCGGTSEIGNMRSIDVFRNSKKVASFDLYAFITAGNIRDNITLLDNDVIVINPYFAKVHASGSLKREMYYQMKENETISSLIKFAGNFKDNAYKNGVRIYRKTGEHKAVYSVDRLRYDKFTVIDGDSLVVDLAKNEYENILTIDGAVWRPGDYQLDSTSNTLKKLINKSGGLKGDAFATAGIITRRNKDFSTSMIKFNTIDVATGEVAVELENYDKILIPTIDSLKEKYTIITLGELNKPDTIGYSRGMRIEDAIILSGGLTEAASLSFINVSRRINNPTATEYSSERAQLFTFKINNDLTVNEDTKNFILQPFDIIVVKRSPQYKVQATFEIKGEVLLPGSYTLSDEKIYLSDITKLSGGFTPDAHIYGTRMTRKYTEYDEEIDKRLEILKSSMKGSDTLTVDTDMANDYTVAIDLSKAIEKPKGEDDILLIAGDVITIPKLTNIVNTIGAVYYSNATVYAGDKLKDYINKNGGYTKMARKRPFVIYANGTVKATTGLFRKHPKIEPGCIIVVPMKNTKNRLSAAEIAGLVTSTSSMATTLATLGISIGNIGK